LSISAEPSYLALTLQFYKYKRGDSTYRNTPNLSLTQAPINICNANINIMSGVQEAVLARHEHTLKRFLAAPISLDPVLTFSADETAESYIFRLTDLMNPMRSDIPPTDVLSRSIILTLLQCAARLSPEHQWSTQVSRLFGCVNFRRILEIGFGARFDKIALQNTLSKVRLEPTSVENCSKHHSIFVASRRMEANLIWGNSNLLILLARLYEAHKVLLQNSCIPPKAGESFMFHKYTTLVAQLSLPDKAVLVTLLPDTFHWGEGEASTSAVPERTLLAQPRKETQSTDRLREWLPNIEFTSNTVSSPSTYAESVMNDPTATSSQQASDGYQEALLSGIILETLKATDKTGIVPKLFGPPPPINEGDIGTLRQGESEKTCVGKWREILHVARI
jgi:hypothetical protein